jgi:hypothetical protein
MCAECTYTKRQCKSEIIMAIIIIIIIKASTTAVEA